MGLLSYIGKRSVTVVPIEHQSLFARNEDVRPSIVVVVRDGSSHRPARIADSRLVRDIGKRTVTIVVV